MRTATDPAKTLARLQADIERRVTEESSPAACELCGQRARPDAKNCDACYQAIIRASSFATLHCRVPKRYQRQLEAFPAEPGKSYLFADSVGTGKTTAGYALIHAHRLRDPRLTCAAYSWPYVLMCLRRGYGNDSEAARQSESIIDALMSADVAMLDDLGAEKITESNQAWVQEILFVILDRRWADEKITIATSNLRAGELEAYLGPRIASRLIGMCGEVTEIGGGDKRLRA